MKVAVIGSRGLVVPNLGDFLPPDTTEIVSGGAKGVDTSAREYAQAHGIKLTEFLPDYKTYGKTAPLKRNLAIIANAQTVLAFWDGESRGTKYVIDNCRKNNAPCKVFMPDERGGFEVWRKFAVEDFFLLLSAFTGYALWFLDIAQS
ncbi:MAG: DUF2493 domain-containing protein [Oscillospiraceae bacterium]|jgi:hypothetical protein|nr:DUF2493 domain-containing protein [Oscillospiraceae bacterium]